MWILEARRAASNSPAGKPIRDRCLNSSTSTKCLVTKANQPSRTADSTQLSQRLAGSQLVVEKAEIGSGTHPPSGSLSAQAKGGDPTRSANMNVAVSQLSSADSPQANGTREFADQYIPQHIATAVHRTGRGGPLSPVPLV